MKFSKTSKYIDYGKGSPGYNEEVCIFTEDGIRIARAFGPNVHGWCIGEFKDLTSVLQALALPDGPIDPSVNVLGMLSRHSYPSLV